jgi:TonB family protein
LPAFAGLRVPSIATFEETNVSHDSDHDEPTHGATTIRAAKGGGGGGKLLLGALAAVVLVGGGYFVWKNLTPAQDTTELAYNDPYADDSLRAGPVESDDNALASTASTDDSIASPDESEPAPPPARRSATRSAPVPEETIGVTPASVTTEDAAAVQDGGDIVVTAAPRPVWVRTPTERRLTSLYPTRALERGREGEARLQCTVLSGGALDCARVEETPGGFGNAALRVARTLRHAPTRADGSDAAGTPVNLRVVFRIDENQRG